MAYSEKKSKKRWLKQYKQKRENGFDMNFRNDKLPGYDALHDNHLRHYFENRNVQSHLLRTGLIDNNGTVMNPEKNKSKLFIIEQEFKNAEKAEFWRKREEEEMRRRVQKKRHDALASARRLERLQKMKEEREIRRQIMNACNSLVEIPTPKLKTKKKKKKKKKTTKKQMDSSEPSFFITDSSTPDDLDKKLEEELSLSSRDKGEDRHDFRRCSTLAEAGSDHGSDIAIEDEAFLELMKGEEKTLEHDDLLDDADIEATIAGAEAAIAAATKELDY